MGKRHLVLLGLLAVLELTSTYQFDWPVLPSVPPQSIKQPYIRSNSKGKSQIEPAKITQTNDSRIPNIANNSIIQALRFINETSWNYDHDEFENYPELKQLTIENQQINSTWLSTKPYIFSSSSLIDLHLRKLGLRRLSDEAFTRTPNLICLSLAYNQLTRLFSDIFEPLEKLQALDLSWNLIKHTWFLMEHILPSLNALDISHNYLTSLNSIRSKSLQNLDVSNNYIEDLATMDFRALPELKLLKIRANNLNIIDSMLFSRSLALKTLDLSYNENLKSLPDFSRVSSQQLDMYRLYCSKCGLTSLNSSTFKATPTIEIMNLSNNNLSTFSRPFAMLRMLKSLSLAYNNISYIPDDMFYGAETLTFLDLSGNPLKSLSVRPFWMLNRFKVLIVDDCRLQQIWDLSNGVLKSLRTLAARGNRIERVSRREIAMMPNLTQLGLFGNPLVCGEDFSYLRNWTLTKRIFLLAGTHGRQGSSQLCLVPRVPEKSSTVRTESFSVANQALVLLDHHKVDDQKPSDQKIVPVIIDDFLVYLISCVPKNESHVQQQTPQKDSSAVGTQQQQRSRNSANSQNDSQTCWRKILGVEKTENKYKPVQVDEDKSKVITT